MPGDINAYALSIAFDLQDNATSQLDDISQSFENIERQISRISINSMAEMKSAIIDINKSLVDVSRQYTDINGFATKANIPIIDSNKIIDKSYQSMLKEADLLKNDFTKNWEGIDKILAHKNQMHTDEQKLIQTETGMVRELGRGFDSISSSVMASSRGLEGMVRQLFDVRSAIRESISAAEMFNNINYRSYGTQTQLVGRSHQLAMEYGILGDKAREALAYLGNLSVPETEINKLTESTVKFSKATGVSIYQTSTYQKMLLSLGANSQESEKRLLGMADAMRRFGLDMNDVNAVMRTQEQQSMYLRETFGEKTAMQIQQTQLAMASLGKELGATPETIARIQAGLGTIEPWRLQQIGQLAGLSADQMKTSEGQTMALAKASASLADQLRVTTDENIRQSLIQQTSAIYGDQLGRSISDLAVQQAAAGDKAKDLSSVMKLLNKDIGSGADEVSNLSKAFASSTATIDGQMQLLRSSISNSIGMIVTKITPGIILILQLINTVVMGITWAIAKFSALADSLGPVGTAFKYATAIVFGLAVAITFLTVTFAAFGMAANIASSAGLAVGRFVELALTGLSKGLATLSGQTPTMLALSALLFSMGAGALMFAAGVSLIAQSGEAGMTALAGLTVSMIAFSVGLAIAGTIAQTAQVGLAVLSLALLSIGASAYMLAQAMQIMVGLGADGTQALIVMGVALVALAIALVVIGAAAMPVIPGLLAVAAVLLVVGVAAILVATAVSIVVKSMQMMNAELALNVLKFVLILGAAAPVMILVGGLLIVGATFLVAGGLMLAVAGVLIAAAGILLMVGGVTAAIGTTALLLAGAEMIVAGPLLAAGSLSLIAAAPILVVAGLLLVVAGASILIAGALMLPGAAALAVSGLLISYGGAALLLGSVGLIVGSVLLTVASVLLTIAAPLLLIASLMLLPAGIAMIPAGVALVAGGVAILAAGVILLPGAVMIALASVLLVYAGASLWAGSQIISKASVVIVPASLMLLGAAEALLAFGVIVASAAVLLAVSSVMLVTSSALLMVAAVALLPSAVLLAVGAASMSAAMASLTVSALLAGVAAATLDFAADVMIISSVKMKDVSYVLIESSVIVGAASIGLAASAGLLMLVGPAFVVAAASISIGAGALAASSASMLVAGGLLTLMSSPIESAANKLFDVSFKMRIIGDNFLAAGFGLNSGSALLRSSVTDIRYAGQQLAIASPQMILASIGMMSFAGAATSLAQSVMSLKDSLSVPLAMMFSSFVEGSRSAGDELFAVLDSIMVRMESYSSRMSIESLKISKAFSESSPTFGPAIAEVLARPQGYKPSLISGSDRQADDDRRVEDRRLMLKQIESSNMIVSKLDELLKAVSSVGGTDISNIATDVSDIADAIKDSAGRVDGLSNNLNNWSG